MIVSYLCDLIVMCCVFVLPVRHSFHCGLLLLCPCLCGGYKMSLPNMCVSIFLIEFSDP